MSSILFTYVDFTGTFNIFGLFIILFGVMPAYVLPSKLDETADKKENE